MFSLYCSSGHLWRGSSSVLDSSCLLYTQSISQEIKAVKWKPEERDARDDREYEFQPQSGSKMCTPLVIAQTHPYPPYFFSLYFPLAMFDFMQYKLLKILKNQHFWILLILFGDTDGRKSEAQRSMLAWPKSTTKSLHQTDNHLGSRETVCIFTTLRTFHEGLQ